MKNKGLMGLVMMIFLAGCGSPRSAPAVAPMVASPEKQQTASSTGGADLLPGVWKRPIRDGVSGTEGLSLQPNGGLALVNIYSLKGMNWRRSGDTLVLTTRTEKYPEPYESRLKIEGLTDTTLSLSARDDYLAGTYTREGGSLREGARGKVKGTVIYLQRIALPPDAVLQVRLVDVSPQGGTPVPVATQTVSRTSQVPIAFEVGYDTAAIRPDHRYEIEARIIAGGKTLFVNASPCPVLTGGNPETVEVVVSPPIW
jgi:uncharacterized lipoprotein YbaY